MLSRRGIQRNPYYVRDKRKMKYVILPDNLVIQIWDFIMILSIWYCAFFIPFRFGISGGYYTVYSDWFWVFNTIVNAIFFVDTILTFFRAYRDENDRLVRDLRMIGWNYIRSGRFFINLLASLPGSNISHIEAKQQLKEGMNAVLTSEKMRFLFILDLFKLLRLLRMKPLISNSEVAQRFKEQVNVESALISKFLFMITLVSHWVACAWGFIIYLEAGTFDNKILLNINWLSNWYNSSYIEGGLNPIGWENAMPRYWLCLFWAIQSITSIGYGTIAPVTTIEYIFADVLMLICGIFWAYVIGNLVEVVTSMGKINHEYVSRLHEANEMMNKFIAKDLPPEYTTTTLSCSSSSARSGRTNEGGGVLLSSKKRIHRFLSAQQSAAQRKKNKSALLRSNTCAFYDEYPTLHILSPELQRLSALHLLHPLLERIPYLSSKYLSSEEQSYVAMQCYTMEFSSSERFMEHPEIGRGLIIFRRGYGNLSRGLYRYHHHHYNDNIFGMNTRIVRCVSHKDIIDHCLDMDEVLVETTTTTTTTTATTTTTTNDRYSKELYQVHNFVDEYTRILFIPRSVIMDILQSNVRAWKECARWRYFRASFILYSLEYIKKRTEEHPC